jgi:hypothetical protein
MITQSQIKEMLNVQVAGEVDRIVIPNGRAYEGIIQDLKDETIKLAYRNGARLGSAKVVELELIPLQYVTNNAVRAVVKAVSGSKTELGICYLT